ncbi:DUF6765 family protein [Salidesulfovibrio brasiliensis]
MQSDMHYFGTYVMARCAGLKPEACRILASASQLVDDNGAKGELDFFDGATLNSEATGHHWWQGENLDRDDQRQVWVPFHFLPGNSGDTYSERLICEPDSDIARTMMDHHLAMADRPYALHLMGVGAHVYADTFAHYGFSGISSDYNRVRQDSFEYGENSASILDYVTGKWEAFQGELADVSALGHGGMHTYPDRPFLKWRFDYELPSRPPNPMRDNTVTYERYCRTVHGYFTRFAEARPDLADAGAAKEFGLMQDVVKAALAHEGPKHERAQQWRTAMRDGSFGFREDIPPYVGTDWLVEKDVALNNRSSAEMLSSNIFHFYQAASLHRQYVLRELLPQNGLLVA